MTTDDARPRSPRERATELLHEGETHVELEEWDDARRCFEQALAILFTAAGPGPEAAADLGLQRRLHEHLHAVLAAVGDAGGARQHLEASLEPLRALVQREPRQASHRERLAARLLELGDLTRDRGDRRAALAHYTEGEAACRGLETLRLEQAERRGLRTWLLGHLAGFARHYGEEVESIAAFMEDVARQEVVARARRAAFLGRMAALHSAMGEHAVARQHAETRVELLEEVAEEQPDQAARAMQVLEAMQDLAQTHAAAGRGGLADAVSIETVARLRRLVERLPNRLHPRLLLTTALEWRVAKLLEAGAVDEAAALGEESLAVHEQLAEAHPDRDFLREHLARTLGRRGGTRAARGDHEAALRAFRRQARILVELQDGRAEEERTPEHDDGLLRCFERIGDQLQATGDADKAREMWSRCLDRHQELRAQDPDAADAGTGGPGSLDRIAALQMKLGAHDDARRSLLALVALRRAQHGADPDAQAPRTDLARALELLAGLDPEHAGGLRAEAAELRAPPAPQRIDPQDRTHSRASECIRLGDASRKLGHLDTARRYYDQCVTILDLLEEEDPEAFGLGVTRVVVEERLGELFKQTGDLAQARAHHEAALARSRALAEAAPDEPVNQRRLAIALLQLGDCERAAGRTDVARACFEEGAEITAGLAGRPTPLAHNLRLRAVLLERRGDLERDRGQAAAARRTYEEAVALWDSLLRRNPNREDWQRNRIFPLRRLARMDRADGDTAAARARYAEVLAVTRQRAERRPTDRQARTDLGYSLVQMGDTIRAADGITAAAPWFREALEVRRALADEDPESNPHMDDLACALQRVGDVHRDRGEHGAATRAYAEARAISAMLVELEPDRVGFQSNLAVFLQRLVDQHARRGDHAAARELLEERLALVSALAARDPADLTRQRTLNVTLNTVGDMHRDAGQRKAALRSYGASIEVARALVAAAPEKVLYQDDLAFSLGRLVGVLRALGETDAAQAAQAECVALLRALSDRDPEHLGRLGKLAAGLDTLADLDPAEAPVLRAEAIAIRSAALAADGAPVWN